MTTYRQRIGAHSIVGWLSALVLITLAGVGAAEAPAMLAAVSGVGELDRTQSFFNVYRPYVVSGLLIFAAQLTLIVGLLLQRGRRRRAEEAIRQLEARNTAMLRAIPDLMFVLHRDGTYVDYHARDPKMLFVPPERFIGRTIREIMPPELVDQLMDAIERACTREDPVLVEYELLMEEPRYFEARLVGLDRDHALSIVRDVTEWKRARERNRDLAGRLISSQEAERTRIARDLHDGVCQEVASLAVDASYLRQRASHFLSEDLTAILSALEQRSAGVAETLRLLSHGLHPTVLHHVGLVAALQAHCTEVERQHQVHVSFSAEGEVEPASRMVALSLFRIAQEALRNTARYGHARHAWVSLARDAANLTLVVADDGGGFDVAAARRNGGLGLVSIEERARMVKGRATIHSLRGQGTTIDVRVPVHVVDRAHGQEPHHRAPAIRSSSGAAEILF